MAQLRIGSRGSQLALWQANHIAAILRERGHQVEIEVIRTTGDTITDPAVLRSQLEEVRKNALGLEYEEALIGEASIAAPVYGESGNVIAVLSVVIPASEWPASETTVRELRDAARTISRELGASVWSSQGVR